MDKDRKRLAIYADESCLGNGRAGDTPGGAAGVVEWKAASGRIHRWDFWASDKNTTNNRMALRSVIEAFNGAGAKGEFFDAVFTSDSKYIVDGMSSWVHNWIKRAWRRKEGVVENTDLWKEALKATNGHAINWSWVRGHNGHAQNEYANHLAIKAAKEQNASGGLVPSMFEQWRQSEDGRVAGSPAPFPESACFTASPADWEVVNPYIIL